ncbi:hypothetical protein Trydic_g1354 [Trypoxylus dichotomus]
MNCPGMAVTDEVKSKTISEKSHKYVPDIAKNKVDKCLYKAKKGVREEVRPVSQIYGQEMMVEEKALDFVANVPQFTSVNHALYNERQKSLRISLVPKRRENIEVPKFTKEYVKLTMVWKTLVFTTDGDNLLPEGC